MTELSLLIPWRLVLLQRTWIVHRSFSNNSVLFSQSVLLYSVFKFFHWFDCSYFLELFLFFVVLLLFFKTHFQILHRSFEELNRKIKLFKLLACYYTGRSDSKGKVTACRVHSYRDPAGALTSTNFPFLIAKEDLTSGMRTKRKEGI